MLSYELKSFIIITLSIAAFALLIIFLAKSCEPDHENWNAWQRTYEECKIKCHPSKSDYLPITKTCLCETEIK